MGAPKGNQFWKKRTKHGRSKMFETPEILKEACYEYFEYQSQRVWNKVDYKGKDVEKVEVPTAAPFTITGLCIFLGVNSVYLAQFERKLDLSTEIGKGFAKVITHVKEIIYTQKFEGASVGAYNHNIIARDLGLADKKDVKVDGINAMTEEQRKAEIERIKQNLNDG